MWGKAAVDLLGAWCSVGGAGASGRGIYLNIHSLTSSLQHAEIVPTYVPVGAVLIVGLLVFLLFWKRVHLLVFLTSVISAGVAILCGGAAVLTGTHIIQPMLHFVQCSMYEAQSECHCLSPYSRQQLSLEYSDKALAKYVYVGVASCSAVEGQLLQMLYGLCVVYIVTFLVCIAVAVLALLAYHTERLYRRTLEEESYEEIFTVSNSSTPPNTEAENEHLNMIRPSADEGETTPTDIIYSPSDVPVDYNEACRMRRSHSFSQPRRQNQSFDSLESGAVYGCSTLGRRGSSRRNEGQGRLKEHRQRARRAVTLHNLDTQQLMLILSLQMRYLQENSSQCQAQMNTKKLEMQNRRSLTPEPQSIKQKNALLDKDLNSAKIIRSHTPAVSGPESTNP
ncbi:uncharacterized protein LOC112558172 [Pomacea canaliculata]|uniref:uncharacterized protein LOC112558172 n=1 Tax=Pomacea canaliculata TaxID=400727 RepID=UPI000D736AA6|nr:uncharacterized protein LOC112558172 [Pomacea canaliculata]XP_025084247.1 uncharacterized protein LOC112558172 [Pomacea canaliculata]